MLSPRCFRATDDVLVTGATGLVGNNVVRQLVARGVSVRALVRGRGEAVDRALAGLPVDRRAGGLDDARGLEAAADGTAVVIHAAAMVHCGWRHLDEMREANVEGTRRIARAARLAGARLVHVSSVDAIGLRPDGEPADEDTPPGGMPDCPYVVTKREAEAVVLEEVDRGLDAVIVNPVYMIGPWDWKPSSGRMLLEVGAGKGLFAPPGGNDFVDVRDVAIGILAAAEAGRTGRRYILGGHALSYLDAWRIFARVAGRMQPLGLAPSGGRLDRRPRQPVHAARACGQLRGGRHVALGPQFLLPPRRGRAGIHLPPVRSRRPGCLGVVHRARLRAARAGPHRPGAVTPCPTSS
jgi:dihydroflavonol-4-reductase